jgi:glycosyltransferase involved in cell wall biosynthesis
MPKIALVTPHVTLGDAVCTDVFGMHAAFNQRGFDARIFADDWNLPEDRRIKVWPISQLESFLKSKTDLLIYHFSMGWQTGRGLLDNVKWRRVIKYHNVTPPEFFADWSDEYARVCQAGRNELAEIAQTRCERYLSDSAYNRDELVAAGAPAEINFVVPPFNRIPSLLETAPDLEIIDKYHDGKENLLMVGTLFPHKGHTFLLDAFSDYYHGFSRECRLLIVGKENKNLESYARYLRELAAQLDIAASVVFTGEVNDDELKSYYLSADMFVTLSGHEGYCVPIVESMAFNLPIVAFGSSAIPETVAGAGVVWPERDSSLFAETFATLAAAEPIRTDLGVAGQRRYDNAFTNQVIEERLFASLAEFL